MIRAKSTPIEFVQETPVDIQVPLSTIQYEQLKYMSKRLDPDINEKFIVSHKAQDRL
jgi:hypothetical protein